MWEELVVRHCSPTLANLKSAGLFRAKYGCYERYLEWEAAQNRTLNPVGVTITTLKRCDGCVLVFVYRRALLDRELKKPGVRQLLDRYGYPEASTEELLGYLRSRLSTGNEFPHEIGVFLGYPPEDVESFVEKKGKDFLCCDYWKVYHNLEETKRRFDGFHKCSEIYGRLFAGGHSLRQLTVSAG